MSRFQIKGRRIFSDTKAECTGFESLSYRYDKEVKPSLCTSVIKKEPKNHYETEKETEDINRILLLSQNTVCLKNETKQDLEYINKLDVKAAACQEDELETACVPEVSDIYCSESNNGNESSYSLSRTMPSISDPDYKFCTEVSFGSSSPEQCAFDITNYMDCVMADPFEYVSESLNLRADYHSTFVCSNNLTTEAVNFNNGSEISEATEYLPEIGKDPLSENFGEYVHDYENGTEFYPDVRVFADEVERQFSDNDYSYKRNTKEYNYNSNPDVSDYRSKTNTDFRLLPDLILCARKKRKSRSSTKNKKNSTKNSNTALVENCNIDSNKKNRISKKLCIITDSKKEKLGYVREENDWQSQSGTTKDPDILVCYQSQQTFSKKSGLNNHMKTHILQNGNIPKLQSRKCINPLKSDISAKSKGFTCAHCEKSFDKKVSLSSHMRKHTKPKPKCDICNQEFTRKQHLKRHLLIHDLQRKFFVCPYCNKRFTQNINLKTHMKLHTSKPDFKCVYCGKEFFQKQQLLQHIYVHTDHRPFECKPCSLRFITKNDYNRHLVYHYGNKIFRCFHCDKRFYRKSNLKLHILRIHLPTSFMGKKVKKLRKI